MKGGSGFKTNNSSERERKRQKESVEYIKEEETTERAGPAVTHEKIPSDRWIGPIDRTTDRPTPSACPSQILNLYSKEEEEEFFCYCRDMLARSPWNTHNVNTNRYRLSVFFFFLNY